jgi:uncharacterized membrane protein
MTERRLRTAIAVVAVLGLGVAGYLTYVHYADVKSVCAIAHGCEKVQHSHYSKLAGVPVALLGLLGYAAILVTLLVRAEAAALACAAIALSGLGFSAYLTYREIFTLHAICIWCVASAVLMALLAGLSVARLLLLSPGLPAAAEG